MARRAARDLSILSRFCGPPRAIRPLACYRFRMSEERRQKGSRTWASRAMATAALLCCAASGCGDDGPAGLGPASLPNLFGDKLYRADGSTVAVEVLDDAAVIGIYFASRGCPACGGFTPLLVDVYNQLRESGRSFEVVLVSAGVSESFLLEYMVDSEMPWMAVPPLSKKANTLGQRYNIRWIPTLVIIDGAANVISRTGREELVEKGVAAYDDWLAAAGS